MTNTVKHKESPGAEGRGGKKNFAENQRRPPRTTGDARTRTRGQSARQIGKQVGIQANKQANRQAGTQTTVRSGAFSPTHPAERHEESLFFPLSQRAEQELHEFYTRCIPAVRPLTRKHRQTLAGDIVSLSRLLTVERGSLRKSYWSSPGFVSAYLYYFLPWNLVRLVRLLQGIPLPRPQDHSLLVDIASGPATVPLALWLAKPEFRSIPLTVVLHDKSAQPLACGKALLHAVGADTHWTVRTCPEPLWKLPKERVFSGPNRRPYLVTSANFLNEFCAEPYGFGQDRLSDEETAEDGNLGEDLEEGGSFFLEERLGQFLRCLDPFFDRDSSDAVPDGTLSSGRPQDCLFLFVEPGTRFGGKIIMLLRALLLERGLRIHLPCTHSELCPLLKNTQLRTWCHFTFDVKGIPPALEALSTEARLLKRTLSLSPLLAGRTNGERNEDVREETEEKCRILSAPFFVPKLNGMARYGCSRSGLLLHEDREWFHEGSLVTVRGASGKNAGDHAGDHAGDKARENPVEIDEKSGARIVRNEQRVVAGAKETLTIRERRENKERNEIQECGTAETKRIREPRRKVAPGKQSSRLPIRSPRPKGSGSVRKDQVEPERTGQTGRDNHEPWHRKSEKSRRGTMRGAPVGKKEMRKKDDAERRDGEKR